MSRTKRRAPPRSSRKSSSPTAASSRTPSSPSSSSVTTRSAEGPCPTGPASSSSQSSSNVSMTFRPSFSGAVSEGPLKSAFTGAPLSTPPAGSSGAQLAAHAHEVRRVRVRAGVLLGLAPPLGAPQLDDLHHPGPHHVLLEPRVGPLGRRDEQPSQLVEGHLVGLRHVQPHELLHPGLHEVALGEGLLEGLPLLERIGVQAGVQGRREDEPVVVLAEQRLPHPCREAGAPLGIDLVLVDPSEHAGPISTALGSGGPLIHRFPLRSTFCREATEAFPPGQEMAPGG